MLAEAKAFEKATIRDEESILETTQANVNDQWMKGEFMNTTGSSSSSFATRCNDKNSRKIH